MSLLLSTCAHPHVLRDVHPAPQARQHRHSCYCSSASGTASWAPAQSPSASQQSPASGLPVCPCTSRRQLCTGLASMAAMLTPVLPAAAALLDEGIATDVLAQTGEPAEVSVLLTPANTAADTAVRSQVCGITGGGWHVRSHGRLLGPQICCCQLTLPGQSHAHEYRQPGLLQHWY